MPYASTKISDIVHGVGHPVLGFGLLFILYVDQIYIVFKIFEYMQIYVCVAPTCII